MGVQQRIDVSRRSAAQAQHEGHFGNGLPGAQCVQLQAAARQGQGRTGAGLHPLHQLFCRDLLGCQAALMLAQQLEPSG